MLPQMLNIKISTELFGCLRKHKYGGKNESGEKCNENGRRVVK